MLEELEEPPGVSLEELPGAPLKELLSEEELPPGPPEPDGVEVGPPGVLEVPVDERPGVFPRVEPEGEPEAFPW